MWHWITIVFFIVTYSDCVKFGPDNRYTCHCYNDEQCNRETGRCNGDCTTGWSGTSCQKQNVAFEKPSSQVDTMRKRISDLAVDGDRTTNIPNKCSDTSVYDSTRWWRVDLQDEYPIKNITIFYRSEPAWGSLNGYAIHVSKENQDPELCFKDKDDTTLPSVNNLTCERTLTGRYVNISNFHRYENGRYLTLCEVEIYVCSVGTFGPDCNNFCHCLRNERCTETGRCTGRCADGWTGTTCSQKCAAGFYGEDCEKNCDARNCLNNKSCDHATGECIDGCQPGYQPVDCTRECDIGFYGRDCLYNCSARFCKKEEGCSIVDGACCCLDGYQGIDCVTKIEPVMEVETQEHSGSNKQTWTIVGTILGLIIGFMVGVFTVLVILKLRSKAKDEDSVSDSVSGNQTLNNSTQHEATLQQAVTQPPSNTINNQDDHYSQLDTIYKNENAYQELQTPSPKELV